MPGWWRPIIHLLHLTRATLVFVAISNVWVMLFLAHGVESGTHRNPALDEWPLGLWLLLSAIMAAGLHGYGVALNDVLDVHHDRLFRPQRPIPAGRVARQTGLVVAVISLIFSLLGAAFFGTYSTLLCLVAAAALLFYNTGAKHLPATGILTLGLVRAASMFVVNPHVGFAWPIWLMMSQVVATSALVHRMEGRRPQLHERELWALVCGWVFWSLALVVWMKWRDASLGGYQPYLWLGPLALCGVFIGLMVNVAWRTSHSLRASRAAGGPFLRLSLLWLILYDTSWLLGAGLYWQSAVHLVLFAAACVSARAGPVLADVAGTELTYRIRHTPPVRR